MKRFLLVLFLLAAARGTFAASIDTMFVYPGPKGWVLQHTILPGESLGSIARRYNLAPEALAADNKLSVSEDLSRRSRLAIPLADDNLILQPPRNTDTARPLYYRVVIGDNLFIISQWAGVSRELLTAWNEPMHPGGPLPGQVMLVGWVRYDPTSFVAGPATVFRRNAPDPLGDTVEEIPSSVLEGTASTKPAAEPTLDQLWKEQTIEGTNVLTEKGTAGFFSIHGNAPGAAVYAFHNGAARGTVMLVRNLNNGRSIYVKVLGPLPDSKQYAGCVLGLSDGAKAALGVRENKVFCEMSYAGY